MEKKQDPQKEQQEGKEERERKLGVIILVKKSE